LNAGPVSVCFPTTSLGLHVSEITARFALGTALGADSFIAQ
jgi:hypothetical protein